MRIRQVTAGAAMVGLLAALAGPSWAKEAPRHKVAPAHHVVRKGAPAPKKTAHPAAKPAASPWLKTSGNTVDLLLIAAYGNNNGGFNFDGAANGAMVVTVPLGAVVHVTFENDSASVPHSAVIVPYAQRNGQKFTPAFPGAETPNPTQGVTKGKTQAFTFRAAKPGEYAIVCAVPGHAASGMWDVLRVVKGAKPSIKL